MSGGFNNSLWQEPYQIFVVMLFTNFFVRSPLHPKNKSFISILPDCNSTDAQQDAKPPTAVLIPCNLCHINDELPRPAIYLQPWSFVQPIPLQILAIKQRNCCYTESKEVFVDSDQSRIYEKNDH